MADYSYDIAVVGGGILGVATAMELVHRHPRLSVGVLEKEERLAAHQTGHNSGVIHSGIYYKPGSLKAQNCVTGSKSLMEFCDETGVAYELCGKVIVATREDELGRLDDLHERGVANGVPGLEMIGPERLRELEPHSAGIRALWSPNTGIVDYTEVTEAYSRRFQENGGDVVMGAKVKGVSQDADGITVETTRGDVSARYLVNCAGLYAHNIAHMMGAPYDLRIIPFRGEYFTLTPEGASLVRGLIYPVPDPRFPFLGVHFTKGIHGSVEAGPNAVLAFAQEGYTKFKVNIGETLATLGFPGFLGHGGPLLEDGVSRVLPLVQQGRLHTIAAAAGAGGGAAAPRRGRRRRSGAGGRAHRSAGGRLPHHRDGQRHPRPQRAIAGRDGVAEHKQGHRGHGGRGVRAAGVGGAIAASYREGAQRRKQRWLRRQSRQT